MRPYITTWSGVRMDPIAPRAEDFRIEDIAHALSLVCRGNGHVKHFFSVGQHCLHCAEEALARGESARVAMASLLHDASEAYMSDVPRPLKACLPAYKTMEERLMAVVYETFLGAPLTAEEAARVKAIDDDMLYFNLRDLLNDPPPGPEPVMKSAFFQDFVPFEEVERAYLARFASLAAMLSQGSTEDGILPGAI